MNFFNKTIQHIQSAQGSLRNIFLFFALSLSMGAIIVCLGELVGRFQAIGMLESKYSEIASVSMGQSSGTRNEDSRVSQSQEELEKRIELLQSLSLAGSRYITVERILTQDLEIIRPPEWFAPKIKQSEELYDQLSAQLKNTSKNDPQWTGLWGLQQTIREGITDLHVAKSSGTPPIWQSLSNIELFGILVISAGTLGSLLARIRSRQNLTGLEVPIGMTTGMLTFLALIGGKSVFFLDPDLGATEFNPFSVALAALLAGLFSERFYTFIGSVLDSAFGQFNRKE